MTDIERREAEVRSIMKMTMQAREEKKPAAKKTAKKTPKEEK